MANRSTWCTVRCVPGQHYHKHTEEERVNHPPHYNQHPSGVEYIDIVEHFGFNVGNAIKYLWRAGRKDKDAELEDLRKAAWYVNREIERLEKQHATLTTERSVGSPGELQSPRKLQPDTSPAVPGPRAGTDPPWTQPVSDRAEAGRGVPTEYAGITGRWWSRPSRIQSEGTKPADSAQSPDAKAPEKRRDETVESPVSQRVRELTAELIRLTIRRDTIKEELLSHASESSGSDSESLGEASVCGTTAPGPRPGDS